MSGNVMFRISEAIENTICYNPQVSNMDDEISRLSRAAYAAINTIPAEPTDDVQLDNMVEDVYVTGVRDNVHEWYGVHPWDEQMAQEMHAQFRHDLAALGIRFVSDPIGVK